MGHQLLVLGAGTAGTMVANKLRTAARPGRVGDHRRRPRRRAPLPARLPVHAVRHLQPRSRSSGRAHAFIADGVELVLGEVDRVDAAADEVLPGRRRTPRLRLPGHRHRHHAAPGPDAGHARQPSGARASSSSTPTRAPMALRDALERFDGGRLVVHITEMPIKCPVAPLEFTFLADDLAARARVCATASSSSTSRPLDGAFTKPVAVRARSARMLDERKITVETDFMVERDRPGAEGARVLRRARGPLRPARDDPAQHGRRLRRPLRASATSSTTCPSTSTRCSRRAHDNIFAARRRQQHPGLQGRLGRPLLGRGVRRQLPRARRRAADDRAPSTGTPTASSSPGDGKALLIDFNYDTEPLTGHVPARRRRPDDACSRRRAPTTSASSRSARSTGTSCSPAARSPLPAQMSMAGKHPAAEPTTDEQDAGRHDHHHHRRPRSRRQRRGLPDRARRVGRGARRRARRARSASS